MTWQWLTMRDVLVMQSNRKPLQQGWSPRCHPHPAPAGEWGVLKTTAIQAGWFDQEQNKHLPDALSPKPQIEVMPGDLLMTCAGPRSRCGVPTLVRQTRTRLMMSGKMYRFRPNEAVLPDFLEKWLLSPAAQDQIDSMKTGISESGLNLTHDRFLLLPVPVPPLAEQRRIVDLLEDHLSRLDAADAYIETASTRAKVWHSQTISRALWSSEYPRKKVVALLREPMRNGRSDRASHDPGSGTRTLTLTAVTKNDFTDENTKLTSTSVDRAAGLWLEPGDVFVQRSNTPELVGSSARYDGPIGWAIFPDLMVRLRVDESIVDSRFLVAALRSEAGHRQLRAKAKGAAGSMPKIDQAAIGSALIPVPPLDQQALLLGTVEQADAGLARLHADLSHARRRVATLRRALLDAAFSGRLTPRVSDVEATIAV